MGFKSIYLPENRNHKIILSVQDTGVGIKEADQPKLYKLFGCLTNTREMNTNGIGLGLVISQMITLEFGGATRVKSQFKVGSRFQSSFLLEDEDHDYEPNQICMEGILKANN